MVDEIADRIKNLVITSFSECKCRKCGCMAFALEAASQFIDVEEFLIQLQKSEKDCFECDPCYGAEASNIVQKEFRGRLGG